METRMQLKQILLIAVIAVCMVTGFVGAVEEPTPTPTATSQVINASVPVYTITITGPADIPSWDLERGVNNELDIGPVMISTTAPSTWTMRLDVAGNHDRLWSDDEDRGLLTGMNVSSVTPPVPSDGWDALASGVMLDSFPASTTPVQVPVRIQQFVSTDDLEGDYSIILTYTLSVAPPV